MRHGLSSSSAGVAAVASILADLLDLGPTNVCKCYLLRPESVSNKPSYGRPVPEAPWLRESEFRRLSGTLIVFFLTALWILECLHAPIPRICEPREREVGDIARSLRQCC